MSNKSLRTIANKLQPFPLFRDGVQATRFASMTGKVAIERYGIEAKDVDGNLYDERKVYTYKEGVFVDHFKELQRVWHKFGNEGVLKYIDVVNGYDPETGQVELNKEKYGDAMKAMEATQTKPLMQIVKDVENGHSNKEKSIQPLQAGPDGDDAA